MMKPRLINVFPSQRIGEILQQYLKSLKPPISMSSSDKIVYPSRDESGHANSRKVRSTWPKVIATESYLARWQRSAYGLGPSFPRWTAHDHLRPRATNLTLAAHSLAFVFLRVSYYFEFRLQLPSPNVDEVCPVWCVRIPLREILRTCMFVIRNIGIINYCDQINI